MRKRKTAYKAEHFCKQNNKVATGMKAMVDFTHMIAFQRKFMGEENYQTWIKQHGFDDVITNHCSRS